MEPRVTYLTLGQYVAIVHGDGRVARRVKAKLRVLRDRGEMTFGIVQNRCFWQYVIPIVKDVSHLRAPMWRCWQESNSETSEKATEFVIKDIETFITEDLESLPF